MLNKIKLGVNIDHVATLRQARLGSQPNLIKAAKVAESSGADGIVVHLREDRRHIQDSDVVALRRKLKSKFNLEMSVNADIVAVALSVKPDMSTLVPEKRQELTTEGGLDVVGNFGKIKRVVKTLSLKGIEVSLFIDPQKNQIEAAKNTGAGTIELHTGRYADARNKKSRARYLGQLKDAAIYAHNIGLRVNAGHGLDYENVVPAAQLPYIEELNIGYSIICRAVFVGLGEAVREMKSLINSY
ncbi:MAG: pyridoxine 5'-phosphate synthase [Candidatus Omnitrophota bacterium]